MPRRRRSRASPGGGDVVPALPEPQGGRARVPPRVARTEAACRRRAGRLVHRARPGGSSGGGIGGPALERAAADSIAKIFWQSARAIRSTSSRPSRPSTCRGATMSPRRRLPWRRNCARCAALRSRSCFRTCSRFGSPTVWWNRRGGQRGTRSNSTGSVRRSGHGRGIEDAIEAVALLGAGVELHLRGSVSGEYRATLEQLAASRGVSGRLLFHAQIDHDDLIRSIGDFDIGLALERPDDPNASLTVTNKVFSYLLAGLPVAATSTPGQLEVLERCPEISVCYPAGDSHALARALAPWVIDPAARRAAQQAAWIAARTTYCWERVSARFLDVVSSARRGTSGGARFGGMRRVLIVGADFPPSSLPPAQRVRFIASHLHAFGWNPTVLTARPGALRNHDRSRPRAACSPFGPRRSDRAPGQRGGRGGSASATSGCEASGITGGRCRALQQAEPFDLLFVSVPPYVPMVLARAAARDLAFRT